MNQSNMFVNPSDEQISALLHSCRQIAVSGLSPKVNRPSYQVSRFMQLAGYRIIPVRPFVDEILGERAYGSLAEAAAHHAIDLVNVFRAASHVNAIVDECIALEIRALWLQEEVVDEHAAVRAQAAGITVVMDRCILKDYRRLVGT